MSLKETCPIEYAEVFADSYAFAAEFCPLFKMLDIEVAP